MRKIFKIFYLSACAVLLLIAFWYFFLLKEPPQDKILWGIDFSKAQAQSLGLDWQETYEAILQDLDTSYVKLHIGWDQIENKKDDFDFKDTDWQIQQAQENNVKLIYVLGMKTGRWSECHLPDWALTLSKKEQQEEILKFIEKTVLRYKNREIIWAWQAENEPLFNFGKCPWYDEKFLKQEVALIKSLDATRPVIISDSGDLSLWIKAAKIGDILGVTIYKKRWVSLYGNYGFYGDTIFPPNYYRAKAYLINRFFGKPVISVELQLEPWTTKSLAQTPLTEQEKTMNLDQFQENISYAKRTGLNKFYLWGAEWWYWLKEKQDRPEIWNEAKKLFRQ